MSFTLPVPYCLAARKAAQELAAKMGFEQPEVVHYQELTEGYTYFVMFGECTQTVDYASLSGEGFDIEYMSEDEIEAFAQRAHRSPDRGRRRQPPARTRTASASTRCSTSRAFTGTTASRVTRRSRRTTSAARCPTACSSREAIDLGADAILVSQTVTQQNLHVLEPDRARRDRRGGGRRKQMILTCGGPRVSNELAKELGYDAGFSKGTYPHHVASFIVRELAARVSATRG